jgi:glycosyltransferase involved in cell wall biosynthesis
MDSPETASDTRQVPELLTRRPRLLFLAYHFPPAQTIASVRKWNIARQLVRLGWDVTVVTPKPEVRRHLEDPGKAEADIAAEGIQRVLTDHYWRCLDVDELKARTEGFAWVLGGVCRRVARRLGIDRGVGWIKAADQACLKLSPDDTDIILASGPPFAAFVLAERLAKRLGCPYVLDYRDPWTEVPGMIPSLQPLVVKKEAGLVKGAAAVTTVSQSKACDLDTRFNLGSRLQVVPNGYNPEDLADVKPHDFKHFAIVYAGIFYEPERVITPVFSALKRLKDSGKHADWCFHYYGDHDSHVRAAASQYGLLDHVKLHGRVSRSEALSAIRGANIAVVISSVLEQTSVRLNGIVPGKLYEIIGLGTPILLIAPPGSDIESIAEPTGLARRFRGDDIDGIASFTSEVMSGRTFVKTEDDSLTWERIAKKLDHVLREQIGLSTGGGLQR